MEHIGSTCSLGSQLSFCFICSVRIRSRNQDTIKNLTFTLSPISTNLMIDAVTAEDGQTYSRNAIQDWFRKGGRSSPLTNNPIGTLLKENAEMQRQVQDFIRSQIQ